MIHREPIKNLYSHQGCYLALPDAGYDQNRAPHVRTDLLCRDAELLKREIREAARLGCDGFVQLFSGLDDLVAYQWLDHPGGKNRRDRVDAIARVERELVELAHSLGLAYYLQNYDLMLDEWVARLFSEENAESILRGRFREVFQNCGCDGIIVTPTEAYNRGSSIWHPHFLGPKGVIRMADLYRKLIVQEQGKELRFRLWLLAENREQWKRLSVALPEDVSYTVKCTAGDFWFAAPLNPALRMQNQKLQISVIFDVFQQYHGWGKLLAIDPTWPDFVHRCMKNGVREFQLWGSWAPSCIWPNHLPGYLDGEKSNWAGTYLKNGIWESDALMARLNLRYILALTRDKTPVEALALACRQEDIPADLLENARDPLGVWWEEYYLPIGVERHEFLAGWATVFQSPRKTWRMVLQQLGADVVRSSLQRMLTATEMLRLLLPREENSALTRIWNRTLLFFDTHNAMREAVLCDPALVAGCDPRSVRRVASNLEALTARWSTEFPVEGRLWQITDDYPDQPRPTFLRRGSMADYARSLPCRCPADIPPDEPWTFGTWHWEDEHEKNA
ncbi:hypothetical protein BH09VER1_BH09VER1_19120 [soil metagenome]